MLFRDLAFQVFSIFVERHFFRLTSVICFTKICLRVRRQSIEFGA